MTDLLTAADVLLMQELAQRIAAVRPELVNSDASYGELAWNWGKGHAAQGASWVRRLWFAGDDLVAWGWAQLPRSVRLNDGSVNDVTGAYLAYQVHPGHAGLADEVIDWFDATADGLERTVLPGAADKFGLERWAAHGYRPDPEGLGETGSWTQLNERDLEVLETPVLPDGFRFRTAAEAGPEAAVQAHVAAWGVTAYTLEGYEGVRATPAYRSDLHILVEAPDATMAASTIMWWDEANKTVEFEPVGTHPDYRRLGLGRAMLLHGMDRARAAGAAHATVACLGAPGHPSARGLYYSVGFRAVSRDVPLLKPA
ncbi:GNAT family N-acetyltransferase [Amycolatopsis rubida]|uniref:Acetyltransferase (GNAT) family protein n=1 Tax=Amycolatopsis rubida TaxID=112413 RepID=A0A1I6BF17_9PSEU|nr:MULTISPECIES: GNAT family N-acetyltransferase [Amycolatopsis]MYW89271.1 GNAT family N-acetyltransferase [Amycolatopsis rubida]NEC54249.1 GNAT family N-acetyltransferase [Amycolatopsis rubida]OAP29148.1 Acetyltransferase (GNAT) family protein [Amycolatopsis sp. M39]SFQ79377.1 Acetyltransferase (GNAT) family protein [Amycolatopsis rubida]